MKNILVALAIALILAAPAYSAEYLKIGFTGNVSANYSAAYALGENGTNYLVDNGTLVFRAPSNLDSAIAITADKTVIVEMAQIYDEGKVMSDLRWMAENGILNGIGEDDFAQIQAGMREMMVISADKAASSKPCCLLERQVAPLEWGHKRLVYINSVKLPPQGIAVQPMTITAAVGVPDNGSKAAESVPPIPDGIPAQKVGVPPQAPQEMPIAVGIRQQDSAYSGAVQAEKKEEPFPFIPIIGGIILIAIAAMLLLRQQTVALQEESPEVRMALSNETRVAIMRELEEVERIPTDISTRIGKSKATISEHLEQLVKVGLLEKVQTPGRKFVYYKLSSKGRTIMVRRKMAG